MIFKRAVARLHAQDWFAITVELAIVIIGVFIGTQVGNWNEERLERRETQRTLTRLKPELQKLLTFYASTRTYYATTRAYAATALAGWRSDPKVSDRDFVIAAYQASQIYVIGLNSTTWATIFGADRLRTIDDPLIRNNLAFLMYSDTNQIDTEVVDSPYRLSIRSVIPVEIQDSIRAKCGDRSPPDNPQLSFLPMTCDLNIPPAAAAAAAAALRASPQLANGLRWQTAAAASFLGSMEAFEKKTSQLKQQIDSLE